MLLISPLHLWGLSNYRHVMVMLQTSMLQTQDGFCIVLCCRNEGLIPSNYVTENRVTNLEIYE